MFSRCLASLAVALFASGVLSASAQSLNLSTQCEDSLAAVAASSDGQCLNADGLIPLALAGSSDSLIDPFNKWLTGFCSQPACANSSLSTILTNITQGCATDLSVVGFSQGSLPALIASVEEYYPLAREIACLKDNSANQLCVTEELTDVQTSTGSTLSVNGITSLVPQLLSGGFSSLNLTQSQTCNGCTKTAFNLIGQTYPGIFDSDDNTTISNACGADFLNGAQPSGISQTASGDKLPSSGKNGVVAGISIGPMTASMVALAVGFLTLA
ncbi:hypothetical protein FA95DRAFT_1554064 [Auriscalpium vulgare]|uniref:Uncharacterized protein n=1 Tax=Auriscalpium vulgare TaxID=40419 RepID=A0ACB8S5G0_9AGAM|nr:hypothetical protein FA95DRAFT_1554064 [Auriscalpium vulgare]